MTDIVLFLLGTGALALVGWWLKAYLPFTYPQRKEPIQSEVDILKGEVADLKQQVSTLTLARGLQGQAPFGGR